MAYELLTPDACAVCTGVRYAKSIPCAHTSDSNAFRGVPGCGCFVF